VRHLKELEERIEEELEFGHWGTQDRTWLKRILKWIGQIEMRAKEEEESESPEPEPPEHRFLLRIKGDQGCKHAPWGCNECLEVLPMDTMEEAEAYVLEHYNFSEWSLLGAHRDRWTRNESIIEVAQLIEARAIWTFDVRALRKTSLEELKKQQAEAKEQKEREELARLAQKYAPKDGSED